MIRFELSTDLSTDNARLSTCFRQIKTTFLKKTLAIVFFINYSEIYYQGWHFEFSYIYKINPISLPGATSEYIGLIGGHLS